MASVGEKIKFFRKRAGVSQFKLELQTNAAFGSISRIEHSQINPTKETINNIAQSLNLNKIEIDYLLSENFGIYTPEEVTAARKEVEAIMNDNYTLAYLLDENIRLISLSNAFQQIFGLHAHDIDSLLGLNLLELMVIPGAIGYETITKESYQMSLQRSLGRALAEVPFAELEEYWRELFKRLLNYDHFEKAWKEVTANNKRLDLFTAASRSVSFTFAGKDLELNYAEEQLKDNPRFVLVVYTPTPELLEFIAK